MDNTEFMRKALGESLMKWRADRSVQNAGTVMFLAALAAESAPEVFNVNG